MVVHFGQRPSPLRDFRAGLASVFLLLLPITQQMLPYRFINQSSVVLLVLYCIDCNCRSCFCQSIAPSKWKDGSASLHPRSSFQCCLRKANTCWPWCATTTEACLK